jgi:hypothetical protein
MIGWIHLIVDCIFMIALLWVLTDFISIDCDRETEKKVEIAMFFQELKDAFQPVGATDSPEDAELRKKLDETYLVCRYGKASE